MGSRPGTADRADTLLEPLLVAIGLALAVSVRSQTPIWQVRRGLIALGLLTSAAYLVGYLVRRYDRTAPKSPIRALLVSMVVSQPVLLAVWLLDLQGSRIVLLAELVLLFGFLALRDTAAPARLRALAGLILVGLAAYPSLAGFATASRSHPPTDRPDVRYVFSSYTDLSVTTHRVMAPDSQDGGALARLPDGRVLLVAGSGAAMVLDFAQGLRTTPIDLHLPLEVARYRAVPRQELEFYRVFDVEYFRGTLLVTYTHWNTTRDCYTMRLIQAPFDGSAVGNWTTRFESRPCVAMDRMNNESGGRMAVLDSSHVLLTIGTFTIEYRSQPGWRDSSDYGKILALDLGNGTAEVFTVGHRNPEGLLIAGDRIWSTEHGPQGGDELNLLRRGADYGWPLVSYGTDYGRKTLELGHRPPGDHTGYAQPVFAWLPSIGVSNLIRVSGRLFPRWKNDLLVGSLSGLGNGSALFRVRLLDDRPVTVERIPVQIRVRDLLELPDGPVVLWDGRGRVLVLRPADHVFSSCTGCHSVLKQFDGIGPDLFGVVGRRVAAAPGFEYSPALRAYGGTWTPARLDRFLANPQAEVPGTAMDFRGVPDSAARAEIIRYLTEITGGRP